MQGISGSLQIRHEDGLRCTDGCSDTRGLERSTGSHPPDMLLIKLHASIPVSILRFPLSINSDQAAQQGAVDFVQVSRLHTEEGTEKVQRLLAKSQDRRDHCVADNQLTPLYQTRFSPDSQSRPVVNIGCKVHKPRIYLSKALDIHPKAFCSFNLL